MSEKIDWSKAPEGAMVLLKHVRDNHYAWAVSHAEESDAWMVERTGFRFRLMKDCWRVVSTRPTTTSWSGEGMPPVGVVCMAGCEQVVIVAHHCNGIHAIYAESESDGLLYYGEPNEFRPISTPEQIAADEREAAIDEMLAATQAPGSCISLRVCEHLYDAGYRKEQK